MWIAIFATVWSHEVYNYVPLLGVLWGFVFCVRKFLIFLYMNATHDWFLKKHSPMGHLIVSSMLSGTVGEWVKLFQRCTEWEATCAGFGLSRFVVPLNPQFSHLSEDKNSSCPQVILRIKWDNPSNVFTSHRVKPPQEIVIILMMMGFNLRHTNTERVMRQAKGLWAANSSSICCVILGKSLFFSGLQCLHF